jgi:hypothetical protein
MFYGSALSTYSNLSACQQFQSVCQKCWNTWIFKVNAHHYNGEWFFKKNRGLTFQSIKPAIPYEFPFAVKRIDPWVIWWWSKLRVNWHLTFQPDLHLQLNPASNSYCIPTWIQLLLTLCHGDLRGFLSERALDLYRDMGSWDIPFWDNHLVIKPPCISFVDQTTIGEFTHWNQFSDIDIP